MACLPGERSLSREGWVFDAPTATRHRGGGEGGGTDGATWLQRQEWEPRAGHCQAGKKGWGVWRCQSRCSGGSALGGGAGGFPVTLSAETLDIILKEGRENLGTIKTDHTPPSLRSTPTQTPHSIQEGKEQRHVLRACL